MSDDKRNTVKGARSTVHAEIDGKTVDPAALRHNGTPRLPEVGRSQAPETDCTSVECPLCGRPADEPDRWATDWRKGSRACDPCGVYLVGALIVPMYPDRATLLGGPVYAQVTP